MTKKFYYRLDLHHFNGKETVIYLKDSELHQLPTIVAANYKVEIVRASTEDHNFYTSLFGKEPTETLTRFEAMED